MAKYNATAVKQNTPTVKNLAGGDAYKPSDKMELVSIVLTSFLGDQFYRSGSATENRLRELVAKIPDKQFVAKAALYGRNEFGMRSVSHVIAADLGKHVKGEEWTKRFFKNIVRRPDDMLEILAFSLQNNGDVVPNAMKKGFASAIEEMNEYSLAKYRGEGRTVNMYDVVNLVHPRPTPAVKALMTGELKPAETWEVALTQAGQSDEVDDAKEQAWATLLSEKKLGYFALLRNLNNIRKQAPEALPLALEQLVDEKAIRKSLVLPFRFQTAYKLLEGEAGTEKILAAISKAATISLANVPTFEGKTLVALDVSGSMGGFGRSNSPASIGALFAAALGISQDNVDLMTFDTKAAWVTIPTGIDLFGAVGRIPFRGGGTDFHLIFDNAKEVYDRIIVLSDMQGWVEGSYRTANTFQTSFKAYKARTGANPMVYSFDLTGYGTLAFPEDKVCLLAGFSDKVFDLMGLIEGGNRKALVDAIEAVTI